ncbi:MAG: hypothetical protein DWQ39_13160 [Bacteroidetes bacterium]|nr:MAG: hypothetical protein DWQ39_13160 [Bacteroidota bacterium]REK50569.1 MAG: hypothetical protein DWQ48_04450 [Bacteroidota bacterium]
MIKLALKPFNAYCMEIKITPNMKLSEIQDLFQKRFNFLKIEFFKTKKDAEYTADDILDPQRKISALSENASTDSVEITGLMKVSDVEKDISDKLGLHVEIFRKSGKVWLKTSSSDHWTLVEQNARAQEYEKELEIKPEQTDWREQE